MFVGMDIGSTTSKALVLDDGEIISASVLRNTWDLEESGRKVLHQALEEAGMDKDSIDYMVLTGYGRRTIDFSEDGNFGFHAVPEIIAHGKGTYHLLPSCRTIIDIGGQDSKVISLDDNGAVVKFQMNDKCAAGTGRYLDKLAEDVFQIDVEMLGELSLKSEKPVEISSQCTVFAESEIITYLSHKEPKENIIAGMHRSLCSRVLQMGKSAGIRYREDIVFSGGVAKNVGVKKAFEILLGKEVLILDQLDDDTPQLTAALGAAQTAKEEFEKKGGG